MNKYDVRMLFLETGVGTGTGFRDGIELFLATDIGIVIFSKRDPGSGF